MVSCTNLAYLFVCLFTTVAGDFPEGHIFQITPECGSNAVEDAKINIVTDLDANVIAECRGRRVPFTTSDGVHFQLLVSYPTKKSRVCVFKRKRNTLVFSVNLLVRFGRGNGEHSEEEYTVSCSFNPSKPKNCTHDHTIEGLIDGIGNETPRDDLTFDLHLVDVLGRQMSRRFLRIGRVVKMKGQIPRNETDEFGIRPVFCDAIDGSARYPILRDGCGDGLVFSKNDGFITTDTFTTTPFFNAFGLKNRVTMKFECHYEICKKSCYGSSCRRRRLDML